MYYEYVVAAPTDIVLAGLWIKRNLKGDHGKLSRQKGSSQPYTRGAMKKKMNERRSISIDPVSFSATTKLYVRYVCKGYRK